MGLLGGADASPPILSSLGLQEPKTLGRIAAGCRRHRIEVRAFHIESFPSSRMDMLGALCSEDFCQRHHGSPRALLRSQSQVVLCVGAAKLGDSCGFVWVW